MLMSKAAYAKHCGVSRQTVYDWIAKGDLVMSGSKIDVEASERRQQSVDGTQSENTTVDRWPHRTLEMTWAAVWASIKANDGKSPAPATDADVELRVRSAAEELGWDMGILENGGVWLCDGDGEYYFQEYDYHQNAASAISLLRREICYTADTCPDELDNWNPAGLEALSTWAKA
ncbi:hypothetical protein [Serratia ureilytica]|uniref:hypothetical protein n=1 Tax=Serratia ureilytica TaxID=300181 RepID=UPI001920138F|nr:hypothetical protein [Serratia ureilytica]MBL0878662.1 hypothetical protein [Serratia ureilytica]MDN2470924.1 helix-turn-helix domain-containing protein [Serratia ureilytica]